MLTKLANKRRWTSDQLVRFVDIVFGVVVGQSLLKYIEILRNPLADPFATSALIVVILTVAFSWIGYHKSMYDYPYKAYSLAFNPLYRLASGFRLFVDFSIVVVYVLMLFSVADFVNIAVEQIDLSFFIGYYIIIYMLYLFDGALRIAEYRDKNASKWRINLRYGATYLALFIIYYLVVRYTPPQWHSYFAILNWISLIVCGFLCLYYRREREPHYNAFVPFNKKRSLILVVDVDGVLADQVTPVLNKLNAQFASEYVKADILHWDEPLPLASTDIKIAIESSHKDPEFVTNMLPIENAPEVVKNLAKYFGISIATNRAAVANKPTKDWLKNNDIPYDEYHNTSLEGKGKINGDIIIDDYPKNILAFIEKGNRKGIIFTQPWNENDPSLIGNPNIYRAKDWLDVWEIINSFDKFPF